MLKNVYTARIDISFWIVNCVYKLESNSEQIVSQASMAGFFVTETQVLAGGQTASQAYYGLQNRNNLISKSWVQKGEPENKSSS